MESIRDLLPEYNSGGMDIREAGIQCRKMDIRRGRMTSGLGRFTASPAPPLYYPPPRPFALASGIPASYCIRPLKMPSPPRGLNAGVAHAVRVCAFRRILSAFLRAAYLRCCFVLASMRRIFMCGISFFHNLFAYLIFLL